MLGALWCPADYELMIQNVLDVLLYLLGIPYCFRLAWKTKRIGVIELDPDGNLDIDFSEMILFLYKNFCSVLSFGIAVLLLVAFCDRMETDWVNRSEWTQTDVHRSLRTYAHSHIPLITRSLGLTLKMRLSAHSILCALSCVRAETIQARGVSIMVRRGKMFLPISLSYYACHWQHVSCGATSCTFCSFHT